MLIGLTGTLGSGKGTIAQYLAKKHNFIYLSVRHFFAGEILKQGGVVNRANIVKVAAKLKAEHGPLYAFEQLLANTVPSRKMVMESVRTVPEAQYLKQHGDALWALDADTAARYKRTVARAEEADNISFEEFKKQDEAEMHSDDPNSPNLKALKEMANYVFDTNGTREEVFAEVEIALAKLG